MNPIVEKLRAGQLTIGGWIAFASSYVAELMTTTGYDWIALDWEHGSINAESLQQMLQALRAGGTPSFVRVRAAETVWIKQALDMGAGGIIAPMVNTPEQAQSVVSASRFPPAGERSVGVGRWRFSMDATNPPAVNDDVAVVVMIEHIDAIQRLDEILSVPGIDAMFVGPTDLRASLNYDSERTEAAITNALAAAMRHEVPPGIHVHTAEDARRRISQGFRFIALAEAGRLIHKAATDFIRDARKATQ